MIISHLIILKLGNASPKICTENQNTNFIFNNTFSENRFVYEILWNNTLEHEGHR
jgi:hypothetical protein